jgi:DNA-directed RNA polymerase specialized sigma24 family protein
MKTQLPDLPSVRHWVEPEQSPELSAASAPQSVQFLESPDSPSGGNLEKQFHTTHWSAVLAAGDRDSVHGQEALTRLCQTYWLPVYAFVRKRGHSPDLAKDLTQEFFAIFLEKNSVARAVRERGRFRSFLMTSVENFLRNAHERSQAQKRGGGQTLLPLDEQNAEGWYLAEPANQVDPAREFELRWALAVLERAIQRLRREYSNNDRGGLFDALQAHLWGDADSLPYLVLAQRFGMTVANIKTMAHRLRTSYRAVLREEIAQTVAQPGEIDDEILHLMRVVSQ